MLFYSAALLLKGNLEHVVWTGGLHGQLGAPEDSRIEISSLWHMAVMKWFASLLSAVAAGPAEQRLVARLRFACSAQKHRTKRRTWSLRARLGSQILPQVEVSLGGLLSRHAHPGGRWRRTLPRLSSRRVRLRLSVADFSLRSESRASAAAAGGSQLQEGLRTTLGRRRHLTSRRVDGRRCRRFQSEAWSSSWRCRLWSRCSCPGRSSRLRAAPSRICEERGALLAPKHVRACRLVACAPGGRALQSDGTLSTAFS